MGNIHLKTTIIMVLLLSGILPDLHVVHLKLHLHLKILENKWVSISTLLSRVCYT